MAMVSGSHILQKFRLYAYLGGRCQPKLASSVVSHSAPLLACGCSRLLSTLKPHYSKRSERVLHRELIALRRLLDRSAPVTSSPGSRRGLHTTPTSPAQPGSNQPPGDPKNKRDEDEEQKAKEKRDQNSRIIWAVILLIIFTVLPMFFPSSDRPEQLHRFVSWNEFVHHMLARGEVQEVIVRPDLNQVTIVLHEGALIKGKRTDFNVFQMNVPDIHMFEEKLREAENEIGVGQEGRVSVVYERFSDTAGRLLSTIIIVSLLAYLASVSRGRSPISMNSLSSMTRAKFTVVDSMAGEGRGVKFSDVAGLKEAKQEVMEFVDYLKRPQYYRSLGAKVPKGALLLGPPGCGKTLLAKAVATEGQVPFITMNGSEFIEIVGGLGAARVRDLFKEARKRAPCIIYIDEIDAIGRQRAEGGANFSGGAREMEQTLNQLLVEMDGMATKEGVVILASTNRADVLDKALLRPGRFDRHILIDLPNLIERREIFEEHLKSIVLEKKVETYSARLATLTPGFSGADIMNVTNEAALKAARDGSKVVTGAELEYAIERVVGGTEKRSQVMSPEERRVVAVHESGHALVGWLLKHTDALLKVTIVPRTNQALGFAQYTPADQRLYSTEQLFDRMCMALGGRCAESLVFGRVTTGAQNDLQKVTKMAYAQVSQFGMSEAVGLVSFDAPAAGQGRRPYSKRLSALIDTEARSLVTRAYRHTEEVLNAHRDQLNLMADELMSRDTLNYDDVVSLIGPPRHGHKRAVEPQEFEGSLGGENGGSSSPGNGTGPEQQLRKSGDGEQS